MEDTVEDVNRKVKKGYCPPTVIAGNPIMDYAKYIIFGYFGEITINFSSNSGSTAEESAAAAAAESITYTRFEDLEADYVSGKVYPSDLKPAVAAAINRILEPVRRHFESGEPKALLDKIKKFKVTR